jgi:hypothetical protein
MLQREQQKYEWKNEWMNEMINLPVCESTNCLINLQSISYKLFRLLSTLNVCRDKHICITLLEDETLNVQEEDGHNNSFSLRKGHDSVLELSEGEEEEEE